MPGLSIDINWNNCNKHRQGWDLDNGWDFRGRALRTQVHHDTSYPEQSSAKCEVFDQVALRWNIISTIMWQEWATLKDTNSCPDGGTEGMWEAAAELEARACAVLSLG